MACAKCGSNAVVETRVDEVQDSGSFSEEYECEICGAKGFIHGQEEQPPNRWDKFGEAFEGSA
jgi:transcription elongation factor Elf1